VRGCQKRASVLELGFEVRPPAAHIPHVGAIGVIDAPLAQPGKCRLQHGAGGDLTDPLH
jgi:hypothetical protein